MNDIPYCNTKEGMHAKAKELNIKAYNLGCSCNDCNKEFEMIIDKQACIDESIAKQLERSIKLNGELRISIWLLLYVCGGL